MLSIYWDEHPDYCVNKATKVIEDMEAVLAGAGEVDDRIDELKNRV